MVTFILDHRWYDKNHIKASLTFKEGERYVEA